MRSNKEQGFSLLELLVVVAIMTVVGGSLIVAYDGLESQSAKGVATNTIAAVDQAVRTFTTVEGDAPNELDSMVAVDVDGASQDILPAGSTEFAGNLGSKLAGKFSIATLSADQADALIEAGITRLRYMDILGNVDSSTGGAPFTLNVLAVDGSAAEVGYIDEIDIPNRSFDGPRPGSGRNRGRGLVSTLASGHPVGVWKAGSGGINNIKRGAAADDVLIALSLGNSSTLVGPDDESKVGNVQLSAAPFYGDVAKNEYSRYVLLYNVGSVTNPRSKAKLQAVVDARGDFLDEEQAEYSGQKQ